MIRLAPAGRLRILLTAAGAVVVLLLSFLLWRGRVSVEGTSWQPLPKLPFEFNFQPLDHPSLSLLREREKLDDIVGGVEDRLGKLVRLCHWTRTQWEPGDPKPFPPWNALTVLDLIRAGKTGGFCAQYAQVFGQACLSFGWQARYIEIGPPDNPCAHFTTEVWIDPLGKWAVLDPYHDVRFERDGRPLSGLEIHRAAVSGKGGSITVRSGVEGRPVDEARKEELLRAYYYLRLHKKMDHLSASEAPFDWKDKVEWSDPDTVLWHESKLTNPKVSKGPTAPIAVNEADIFDFEVNRVVVEIDADRLRGRATLRLSHFMPGFDHYRIRVGSEIPRRLEGDRLDIRLDAGPVHVEILAVNLRGGEGVPCRLLVK